MAIKSVTISTTSLTYGSCTGGYSSGATLGFPNGECTASPIRVTNGTAPGQIEVHGSAAVPVSPGPPWLLCGLTVPCTGKRISGTTMPGPDQFSERDGPAQLLDDTAQCDLNFGKFTPPGPGGPGGCAVSSAGSSRTETLTLTGPQSSSAQSAQFLTQITWIVN